MSRNTTQTRRATRRRAVQRSSVLTRLRDFVTHPQGRVPTALAIAAVATSSMFFVQVFMTQAQGFDVAEMERAAEELRDENDRLEARTGELRALSEIQKSADELGMKKGGAVSYLTVGDTGVALNR